MSFESVQSLESMSPSTRYDNVVEVSYKLIRTIKKCVSQEQCTHCRALLEECLKNTQPTTKLNVPEIDTTGMEVSSNTAPIHCINVKELV